MAAQSIEIDMDIGDATSTQVTVLVADDNKIFLRGLKRVLEEAGCNVIACVDGAEALEVVRRQPVDVVVLDYRMPRMRGTAVAEAIRAQGGKFARLPIIGISVDDDDQLDMRCRAAGMNEFLSKLSTPDIIEEAVFRWAQYWRNFSENGRRGWSENAG